MAQSQIIWESRRHLEDLDNRGRRNNFRIRGVPELGGVEDVPLILESIFNDLLANPASTKIKMDRMLLIHDFTLKEQIMSKARSGHDIMYAGATIQLYPDLSWLTLQKRRHLKPNLSLLRERGITYRWGFPFPLSASKNVWSATLCTFEDLATFCSELDIPLLDLTDWDQGRLYSHNEREDIHPLLDHLALLWVNRLLQGHELLITLPHGCCHLFSFLGFTPMTDRLYMRICGLLFPLFPLPLYPLLFSSPPFSSHHPLAVIAASSFRF